MAGFDDTAADAKVLKGNASDERVVTAPVSEKLSEEHSEEHDDDREYDRRGVLLPRKARVGGIITPQ